MYVGFALKLNELMTGIFLFAYYIGIMWIIMCELYEDFVDDTNYKTNPNVENLNDNFIIHYKLYEKDAI